MLIVSLCFNIQVKTLQFKVVDKLKNELQVKRVIKTTNLTWKK